MTGVEILASQEVAVTFGFNVSVFWLMFSIVAVVTTLCIGIGNWNELGGFSFAVGAVAGILVGLLFGWLLARNTLPLEYETQYKVTIDDSVSMNEFLDKYEIIDQEGKIYTVKERE